MLHVLLLYNIIFHYAGSGVPSRIADVQVHVYQLCEDGPSHEDLEGEEGGGGWLQSPLCRIMLLSFISGNAQAM